MLKNSVSKSLSDGFLNSQNPYLYIDQGMNILNMNGSAEKFLFGDIAAARPIAFRQVIESVFGAEFSNEFFNRHASGTSIFNMSHRADDGRHGPNLLCINDADEAGAMTGSHVVIYADMCQFDAEKELSSLRSIFRDAFDHSAVCMAVVAPGGEFMQVNDAFCAMLQYSREELLQGGFQSLTHEDDLHVDLAHLQRLLIGESDHYTIEKRYIAKDGSVVWGILSVAVARDTCGKVRYFISQVQDITDRKRAEELLYREAERAMVTLRSIGDAVITCDHNAIITYLNPVAELLTGWPCEDATGLHITKVFEVRDADGQRAQCPVQAAMQRDGTVMLDANCNLVRRNGDLLPVEDSAAPIRDNGGRIIGVVLVFHDVSERRAMSSRLDFLAHHDALTGLPNRVLFKDRIEVALSNARRSGHKCAILFCDLDRFKRINDIHGHVAGDMVLKAVADRLRENVRSGDTICRWAGDEFAVLLPVVDGEDVAADVACRILQHSDDEIAIGPDVPPVKCGLSLGISLFPDDGEQVDDLVLAADLALYNAKIGRNDFKFHHSDFNKELKRRVAMEKDIRQALLEDRFVAYYQPRLCLKTQRVVAAEALCRMEGPQGIVMPGQFIEVAEGAGLIDDITLALFDTVCRDMQQWGAGAEQPLSVSFNVSPISLRKKAICDALIARCRYYSIDPARIEMEITEGVLLEIEESITSNMHMLHDAGFRIALDDFGTGFSNLSYLQQFPVDTIKIDRMFVQGSRADAPLVRAIAALGRSLNMTVVAEGVETPEQHAHAQLAGCDEAQGYLYAHPLPVSAFEAFIA